VKTPDDLEGLGRERYNFNDHSFTIKGSTQSAAYPYLKELGFNFYKDRNNYTKNSDYFEYSKKNIHTMWLSLYIKKENAYKLPNYSDPVKFCKDSMLRQFVGKVFINTDYLYEIFHNAFQRLFEAGITGFLAEKYNIRGYKLPSERKALRNLEIHKEAKEFVVLSMTDLRPGFIIWLVTVAASILVFIGEILHKTCSDKMRNVLLKNQELAQQKNQKNAMKDISKNVNKIKNPRKFVIIQVKPAQTDENSETCEDFKVVLSDNIKVNEKNYESIGIDPEIIANLQLEDFESCDETLMMSGRVVKVDVHDLKLNEYQIFDDKENSHDSSNKQDHGSVEISTPQTESVADTKPEKMIDGIKVEIETAS
jgi:hypothetical protein